MDNQRLALEAVCEQRGWEVVEVYADNGVSGAKGRSSGLAWSGRMPHAGGSMVLVWALDRLGRSLMDLLDMLSELDAVSVALVLHQQAIDTTTPAGRMFFQVTGAFAEFERAMIRSRVRAGLERAKARGATSWAPKDRCQGRGRHMRSTDPWRRHQEGRKSNRRRQRHSFADQGGDGWLTASRKSGNRTQRSRPPRRGEPGGKREPRI